jgi:hypothetical protein
MRTPVTVPAGPTVRFAVPLPPGETLPLESFGLLAVSPDGRHLAYVSGGRLYIRAMDSDVPRAASASEGAWSPFFSPDGQWVGFFAQGMLKTVSVAGGAAEPICDATGGFGGSWADEGTIYFVPGQSAGLWKVAATGGIPEPVTTLDRANGEVSHRWPHVLPGTRAVLFTVWRGPGWDEMDVQMQILASGEMPVRTSRSVDSEYGYGLVDAGLWRGLFMDEGTLYKLGIPMQIKMRPLDAIAGWRFAAGRVSPFLGAGLSTMWYSETADFAEAGDDISERRAGAVVLGGADVAIVRWVHGGRREVRYRAVSGVPGARGRLAGVR